MDTSSTTWTVASILEWIEGYLSNHGDEHPRLSAQWLLSDVLGCSRIELYADLDRPLTDSERSVLRDYTKRRGIGEPLQYITGTTDFRFLTLAVKPGVLIPRPETEVLVSEVLARFREEFNLPDTQAPLQYPIQEFFALDLCTGSGNIACSLAQEVPHLHVFATDISPDACALAQQNIEHHKLEDRVLVLEGDLGGPLEQDYLGRIDLIISNPPYIPTAELSMLPTSVKDFEPELALDGGADGLQVFERILDFALNALKPRGILGVELHETCLDDAAARAHKYGFVDVSIARDLAQKPRVLIAQKSGL